MATTPKLQVVGMNQNVVEEDGCTVIYSPDKTMKVELLPLSEGFYIHNEHSTLLSVTGDKEYGTSFEITDNKTNNTLFVVERAELRWEDVETGSSSFVVSNEYMSVIHNIVLERDENGNVIDSTDCEFFGTNRYGQLHLYDSTNGSNPTFEVGSGNLYLYDSYLGGNAVFEVYNGVLDLYSNFEDENGDIQQHEILYVHEAGQLILNTTNGGCCSVFEVCDGGLDLFRNYKDADGEWVQDSILNVTKDGFAYNGKEIDTNAKAMYKHSVYFEFEYEGTTIGTSFDVISSRSTRYTDITQIPTGKYHVYDYVTYGVEDSEKCFLRSVRIAPDPRNGIIKAYADYECYDSSGCLVEYSSASITLDTESSNYTITAL